ncbi:hypothetical protein [Streptococcus sp. zg-JUN1979]|uniref:hypothetical protein n=1 Tax=Streptococcus sp. zg-JUN1979 TaxID=3391450 RepID=UPI0039A75D07
MANSSNLIPIHKRSKSEQKAISQKGGANSAKVRRQKADLKRAFEALLSADVSNEQMKGFLVSLGYEPTNEMALALVVLQKALNGDIKAFSQISALIDDKK